MSFDQDIYNYKKIIDENITSVYLGGPKIINEPINYILSGGKRIRPILCFLTYFSSSKNEIITDDLLRVSLSIELLHNFTLIHDDIMDKDDLRHGKKTIHNKWNNSIAILSGDAMLSVALTNLNKIRSNNKASIIEKFHDALIEVCEGQALDILYQKEDNISTKEYRTMIDKKTGYMIGLSAELGALLSNCESNISLDLKKYGQLLGRAFQIQDDLMEIISDSKKMGKSLNSDFILRKKTFPFIKANEIDNDKVNSIMEISKNDIDSSVKLFKQFLHKNNIISDTKSHIKKTLSDADSILKKIEIDSNNLFKYSKMILERRS